MEQVKPPTGVPIRRACNRCHAQKLSCKRTGEEPCERCVRLKAECRSSPSLRYRRQQQQSAHSLQRAQQPQHHLERLGRRQHGLTAANARNTGGGQFNMMAGLASQGDTTAASPCLMRVELGGAHNTNQSQLRDISQDGAEDNIALDMVGFAFGLDTRPGPLFSPSRPQDTSWFHTSAPVEHMACTASEYTSLQEYGLAGINDPSHQAADYQYSFPRQPQCHQQTQDQANFPSQTLFSPPPSEASCPSDPISLQPRDTSGNTSPSHVAHHSKWLSLMSDLNKEIWKLTVQIPRVAGIDGGFGLYKNTHAAYHGGKPAPEEPHAFPLDKMFSLSRRLLEALRVPALDSVIGTSPTSLGDLSAGHLSPRSPTPLDHEAFTPMPWQSGAARADPCLVIPAASADSGSVLLALSTYVRLIELYHKVFQLVDEEICSSSRGGRQLGTFKLCTLPDVSLGATNPAAPSPVLQTTVIIRVAEEFLDGLWAEMDALSSELAAPAATRAWTQSPPNRAPSTDDTTVATAKIDEFSVSFAAVIRGVVYEVKVQEEKIRQDLGAIRARLERMCPKFENQKQIW